MSTSRGRGGANVPAGYRTSVAGTTLWQASARNYYPRILWYDYFLLSFWVVTQLLSRWSRLMSRERPRRFVSRSTSALPSIFQCRQQFPYLLSRLQLVCVCCCASHWCYNLYSLSCRPDPKNTQRRVTRYIWKSPRMLMAHGDLWVLSFTLTKFKFANGKGTRETKWTAGWSGTASKTVWMCTNSRSKVEKRSHIRNLRLTG